VVITAAVGEGKVGPEYGRDEFFTAMWNARKRGKSGYETIGQINLDTGLELSGDRWDTWLSLRERAKGIAQVPVGQSLTAAGFCAPAQPVYDFVSVSSPDGIAEFAEATATRGRISYPEIISVDELYAETGIGNQHTAADDTEGVTKPCFTVTCGSDITISVAGYSTCRLFSNFDDLFHPERVAFVTGESLTAHAHKVNAAIIAALVADANVTTFGGGATTAGLIIELSQSVAWHVAYLRSLYRIGQSARFTALIPYFVLPALFADDLARNGTSDYSKTQAEIEAVVSKFGVDVQWVYDWQSPPAGVGLWPTTFNILLYPAASVVKLRGRTLDLGVVRDSTLNAANDFQVFVETFEGIGVIGPAVTYITGLTTCPNGETAAQVTVACASGS
jgi:hypothetical protein